MRNHGTDIRTQLNIEPFLRSINIRYDADHPERISHFQPTAKSIPFLKALSGQEEDRAFFVVAPYGSGKSITATYLLHLIENRAESSKTLTAIEKKLAKISPELRDFSAKRRRHRHRFGMVLVLHGYCRSIGQSIKDAALEAMTRLGLGRQARPISSMACDDIEHTVKILSLVQQKSLEAGCDRILIIWDEFGRHLESLLNEGRHAAFIEIQILAEFVSRSRDVPMTFGLLLHQGLFRYTGQMLQSVRTEWNKIEGRFTTIQYIDDSKEIYRLVAEVVASRVRKNRTATPSIRPALDKYKQFGLFSGFTKAEMDELLSRVYPLEPITLYLLPRLSARVAQNERTLFSFLYGADLTSSVGPDVLYDYFSPSMQSDTAVGGTYRQWLETQSALAKVGNEENTAKALKAACLLGIGTRGERSRASRDLLVLAVQGYDWNDGAEAVVDKLVELKLLLYRKHSDEVSVWHGTDADLRGKLEEEKDRQRNEFNLLDFLSREARPPVWRPVQYNDDFSVRRYLTAEYHDLETLRSYLSFELALKSIPPNCDGKVLYLLVEASKDLQEAETLIRNRLKHERVVVAVPRERLPLFEAALEVWCLLRMQLDSDLVGSDPLITPELQQMTDDARGHLQQLIDRLVLPRSDGPRWFHQGGEFEAKDARDLRKAISAIMAKVYSSTPKINNEMIVRNKPSPVIVNARKKLLLGILERSGKQNLGIEGNFPDASILRTVLVHTGLYCHGPNGRWSYARPNEITDLGLQAVWEEIRKFLTVPAQDPKEPRSLFTKLMNPPFGLRAGLIPILFAAGLKAFPSGISLTKSGAYVTDILPSEVEQLCREPELYRMMVLDLDKKKLTYLRELYKCFRQAPVSESRETDLIRACYDAIESWKAQLPPAAMTTRHISERALKFRTGISRELDPVKLVFEKIPLACDCPYEESGRLLTAVSECKAELTSVTEVYKDRMAATVSRMLALGHQTGNNDVRETARRWADCFSEDFAKNLADGIAKGLLSRIRMSYGSDASLLESLASLLVGKSLQRWDDTTIAEFDKEMRDVVRRVEETALSSQTLDRAMTANGLAQLVQGRMAELFERLVKLIGENEAKAMLSSVTNTQGTEDLHGHDTRGTE